MESAPKITVSTLENETNLENLTEWRSLKEQAPAQAEELVNNIAGFETLSSVARVEVLQEILNELVNDNANRFVAEEVAKKISLVIEEDRHLNRLNQLEVAV